MKRISTIFLQAVVVLIGIGALALLLWEPQIEGRNAHATLFQIYFNDPFLAWTYAASVAFFVALYQAFKLLGHIGRNEAFSQPAIKTLRTTRYCAIIIISFVMVGMIYIRFFSGSDDAAGGIFIGFLIIFGSIIAAAAASTLEGILQSVVDTKPGNNL